MQIFRARCLPSSHPPVQPTCVSEFSSCELCRTNATSANVFLCCDCCVGMVPRTKIQPTNTAAHEVPQASLRNRRVDHNCTVPTVDALVGIGAALDNWSRVQSVARGTFANHALPTSAEACALLHRWRGHEERARRRRLRGLEEATITRTIFDCPDDL